MTVSTTSLEVNIESQFEYSSDSVVYFSLVVLAVIIIRGRLSIWLIISTGIPQSFLKFSG